MRRWRRLFRLFHPLKRVMPSSLFGRALLILVLPTVLVQIVALYIFYDRHWESITRNISSSLAGELSLLVREMVNPNTVHRQEWTALAKDQLGIVLRFSKVPLKLPKHPDPRFDNFRMQLHERLGYPVTVKQIDDDTVQVRIGIAPGQAIEAMASIKRLDSSTTSIFTTWLTGSSLALLLIAILFLRNQIRPISRLAKAAEGFGMGMDDPYLKPAGSKEVRQASRAFLTMKARISRQIATRTAMLSGISHDLRTPLTRMKLQLAMLPASEETEAMARDVREMEQMIGEYLDFARGEDGQMSEPVSLAALLEEIVAPYRATRQPVELILEGDAVLPLRRARMKRAFDNLIANALRYGGACRVTLELRPRFALVCFDDDGPGIPDAEQEMVFQPFRRLEASRNTATGGVGLGLTIVREAVTAQGGTVELANRQVGGETVGLRAAIRLPLPMVQAG